MDEDIEFREMMLKNLETNGFLQDIRAKLRAQIYFSAYENNQLTGSTNNYPNDHIGNTNEIIDKNTTIDTEDSSSKLIQPEVCESLALGLVQDLLDSLNLCHTKSVFKSEVSNSCKIRSSTHIEKILNLQNTDRNNGDGQKNVKTKKNPLLIKLLEKYIQQNDLKQEEIDSLNSSSDNTEKSYNSSASVVVNNDTFISSKTETAASNVSPQLSESL